MKRPRPGQKRRRRRDATSSIAAPFGQDQLAPAGHFEGGAPGEGQQQKAPRVAAVQDQMSHPVGKRLGLAGAGAGGDQQRRRRCRMVADAIFDSAALFWIEAVQMSRAIDRLQLGVPFPFTLGDSIGATRSQCPWPGRGKRGLRHCPERTLDRFATWPRSESPFLRRLPSAIGAALLIVSQAGPELALGESRPTPQPQGAMPSEARCQTDARGSRARAAPRRRRR